MIPFSGYERFPIWEATHTLKVTCGNLLRTNPLRRPDEHFWFIFVKTEILHVKFSIERGELFIDLQKTLPVFYLGSQSIHGIDYLLFGNQICISGELFPVEKRLKEID